MATELYMYRGDDRTWTFTLTADGVAQDVSAATAIRFTAKTDAGKADADAVLTFTLGSGIALTNDGTDGKIDLTISASDTSGMSMAQASSLRLYWDVQVISGGAARTWPEDSDGIPEPGTLTIYRDISRTSP